MQDSDHQTMPHSSLQRGSGHPSGPPEVDQESEKPLSERFNDRFQALAKALLGEEISCDDALKQKDLIISDLRQLLRSEEDATYVDNMGAIIEGLNNPIVFPSAQDIDNLRQLREYGMDCITNIEGLLK